MSSPTPTQLPEPFQALVLQPLVSVLIRSMDRPTLARALASVADQTWPAIEVIVVNAKGASHSSIGPTCGSFPMRMVGGDKPLSRSAAANAGLAAARGEWICFLDDDDWFAPTHIESLARQLQQFRDAVAAYSGVSCVERDADTGEMREVLRYNEPYDAARLLCENYLPIHSVLFSRAAAAKTTGFDDALPIFEDWDFWIQLSRVGPFLHLNEVSATYLLGAGDSGLYGNTALQEEYARRIFSKWLKAIAPQEWAQIWLLCRQGLRARDAIPQLERAREDLLAAASRALLADADIAAAQKNEAHWQQDAEAWRKDADLLRVDVQAARHEATTWRTDAETWRHDAQVWRTDAETWRTQAETLRVDSQTWRAEAQARGAQAEARGAEAQAWRTQAEARAADAQTWRVQSEQRGTEAQAWRTQAEARGTEAQAWRTQAESERNNAQALQREAAQWKEEAALSASARVDADTWQREALAAREAAERHFRVATENEELRKQAALALIKQGEALQIVTKEYHDAVALLQSEQYTVWRPFARNMKRSVRNVWRQLPEPVKTIARKALGRPPAIGTPSPPAYVPGDGGALDWKRALAGGKPGAFTVILFPVIDWHFRIQRPQHLARELGRQGHRVLYLSTTFASGTQPSDTRLIESPAENVHLVQLALDGPPPNIYENLLTPAQALQLAQSLAWLQQSADLGQLVSMVNLPFWRPVATRLPANIVAYDCMDFHAGFSTNTGTMLGEEEALLRDCDLLITTSGRLFELMQAQAPDKPHVLVRNGTQVDHFAQVPTELKLQNDGRPVIGYFGAISEWFDIDLVVAMAQLRPDWRFILVGSTFGCDVTEAKAQPNIELMGEVPYAELPGWVHAFDVCLIPFIINELTSCTNPVKVYEYLSAGKPVVATRMPELEAIADQVMLADDAPGFVRHIESALQASDRSKAKAAKARRAWASGHSWEARAELLSDAIAKSFPKVSAIVLCYNNLELTKACLESVEHNSLYPNLEVVVVDNASADGTPAWLKQWGASRPWAKVILSKKNTGFAAGNNMGLEAATGEILVMLNNDTEVSPGWVQGLRRHFDRDPRLGMVGPVTDNIGNEAKIAVGYTDRADMAAWAASRAVQHAGEQMQSRVLAFFCVALRRAVYKEVGGLDEAFGLGFFEDDDYCNRARQAGWHLAIAEDVFVHHHLSASFDKLKSSTRQELFEKNKAIYERKWGPWVPHVYREAATTE